VSGPIEPPTANMPVRLSLLTDKVCRWCDRPMRARRRVLGVRAGRTVVSAPLHLCGYCDLTSGPVPA